MRRLVMAILIVLFITTAALASPALPDASAFVQSGNASIINDVDNSEVGQALSGILLLLYKVGYGIAVIILFYLAIQLIIAPAQKKAEVKAALTPYFIGLLLLVAGVPIATMIIKMFISVF